MKTNEWIPFLLAIVASSSAFGLLRGAEHAPVGYTDTPMLPGGKWHVHDPDRPQPKVVTLGTPANRRPMPLSCSTALACPRGETVTANLRVGS